MDDDNNSNINENEENDKVEEKRDYSKLLCPFFKDICKTEQCVLWDGEDCSFFMHMLGITYKPKETHDMDHLDEWGEAFESEDDPINEKFKPFLEADDNKLAEELLTFFTDTNPDDGRFYRYSDVNNMFWEKYNVGSPDVPYLVRKKKERVGIIAENVMGERVEQMIENEKNNVVPQVATSIIDWAKTNKVKRISKADVDLFLHENDISLLSENKKFLWSMVNFRLKSNK